MIFFIYLTSSKILSFEYEKKIYAFLLHFTHLSVSLQRFKCSYHMKRLLILTTLFVLCLCMTAQTPSIIDRPKVGLVLGGGGTKGAAELGALKVIEELNIPIDYIAGTSIGAILGGLYATGYRAEQLDSLFRSGLWMTDNVLELLERLTETDEWIDFDELPIPFRCVAVDFDTQEEVVFRNGHLATAMRASMAIPGRTYRCFECPDFFQLTVDNGPKKGQKKWVLVVSVDWDNEQYFVGDFDGTTFAADDHTALELFAHQPGTNYQLDVWPMTSIWPSVAQ